MPLGLLAVLEGGSCPLLASGVSKVLTYHADSIT